MLLSFFYTTLMERILAQVPEVQHFDLWNNQTAVEGEEIPFARPAVFLEILPIDWKTQGHKLQAAEMVFTLRVVTDMVGMATDSTVNDAKRTSAFERLRIKEKVFAKVQGFQAYEGETQFGKIVRAGSQLDTNSGQLNTDSISFKCAVKDSAAVPQYDTAVLKIKLKAEIKNELS